MEDSEPRTPKSPTRDDQLVREHYLAAQQRNDVPPKPTVDYYEDYQPTTRRISQGSQQWPLSAPDSTENMNDDDNGPSRPSIPQSHGPRGPPLPHQYIPGQNRGGRGRPYPRGGPPASRGGHQMSNVHPALRGPPPPPPPQGWRGRDGRAPPQGYRGRPPPRGYMGGRPGGHPRGQSQYRGGPRPIGGHNHQHPHPRDGPHPRQAWHPPGTYPADAYPPRIDPEAAPQSHFSVISSDAATSPEIEHANFVNRNEDVAYGVGQDDMPMRSLSSSRSRSKSREGPSPREESRGSQHFPQLAAPEPSMPVAGILRTSASNNSLPSFKSAESEVDSLTLVDGEKLVAGDTVPHSPALTGSSSDRLVRNKTADSQKHLLQDPVPPLPVKDAARTSHLPNPTFSVSLAPNHPEAGSSPLASARNSKVQGSNFLSVPERTDARASTTSLSGLIKRALNLANNLEHGKTSSKLGTDWMKEEAAKEKKRGSLHSMLASFPVTPLNRSPGAEKGMRQLTDWPEEALRNVQNAGNHPRRRRQICSMPVWLFVLIVLIVLGLVVAAILIPIFLVVVPNHQHSTSKPNTSGPQTSGLPSGTEVPINSSCDSQLSCENGGTNVVDGSSNACVCLCPAGFGGPTCTTTLDKSCAGYTPSDQSSFVFGSSIPPLLSSSASTFSLDLNATALAALFKTSLTSCSQQNSLITLPPSQTTDTSGVNTGFIGAAILYIAQGSDSLAEATSSNTILSSAIEQSGSASSAGLTDITIPGGWSVDVTDMRVARNGQ